MNLKDIYLDKYVRGYIVFKTLSKRKVMDTINHLYHGDLMINESSFFQFHNCLLIKIEDQKFDDYLDLYKSLKQIGHCSTRENMFSLMGKTINMKVTDINQPQLDIIMIGMTQWSQSFILKMNIRHQNLVVDIYFDYGKSYYYENDEIFEIENQNQFYKYIKKYNLEDIKYE